MYTSYPSCRQAPIFEARSAWDLIIRLAEVFDVSVDYLLLDDAPRRPRRTPDEAALGDDRIAATELSEEDLNLVASFIDALVTKTRLKVLASGS